MKYPIKMNPAFKSYIWGGTRLKSVYGKNSPYDTTAETWELSAHPDGESVAANGKYAGMTLTQIIGKQDDCVGAKFDAKKYGIPFPLLIKLIDAADNLSIQVHPGNDYALANHGQFGKSEMWYIVDAQPNSGIYCGFNRDLTKDEYERRIADNTLLEVLNFIPCQKGQSFLINPGTVHAIGKGLLIAEIQQNSNLTYRVYDFGRVGADGKPRELHIAHSVAVSDTSKATFDGKPHGAPQSIQGGIQTLLTCTEYFHVWKVDLNGEATFDATAESFQSLLLTEGSGVVTCGDVSVEANVGECVFIPAAAGKYTVDGNGVALIATM